MKVLKLLLITTQERKRIAEPILNKAFPFRADFHVLLLPKQTVDPRPLQEFFREGHLVCEVILDTAVGGPHVIAEILREHFTVGQITFVAYMQFVKHGFEDCKTIDHEFRDLQKFVEEMSKGEVCANHR